VFKVQAMRKRGQTKLYGNPGETGDADQFFHQNPLKEKVKSSIRFYTTSYLVLIGPGF
jgi:hypothetical protein